MLGVQILTQTVTFVEVTEPYAEDPLEPPFNSPDASVSVVSQTEWGPGVSYRSRPNEIAAHGLEALSVAASRDRNSLAQPQISHHDMASTAITYMAQNLQKSTGAPGSTRQHMHTSHSPTTSISSNNNISFLLNPQGSRSPPIDPSLRNAPDHQENSPSTVIRPQARIEQPAESDQEVAYLLRHFAEAPG